jgi:hypothetical protein
MKMIAMKGVLRPLLSAVFAALLLATAGIPSDAARRAPARTSYDGVWSVAIYTTRGDCDRAVRAAVRITGGRVSADDQSYQAYGAVGRDGLIRVTVAAGSRSASGSGRLSQNAGSGRWRAATGECSGQWTAERRNW